MRDEALTLIVPIALKEVMEHLLPVYSRAAGQSLHVVHMLNPEVPRHVASGALWDIAFTNPSHVREMIDAGSGFNQGVQLFARTPLAFARRGSGTSLSPCTCARVAAVLQGATTIAVTGKGTSGEMFRRLTRKLSDEWGLSAEVEPKLRAMPGGGPMAALLAGEVDVAALPLTNIVPVAGVHAAAICPFDLEVHIDSALCLQASSSDQAQALVDWLLHEDRDATLESLGARRL